MDRVELTGLIEVSSGVATAAAARTVALVRRRSAARSDKKLFASIILFGVGLDWESGKEEARSSLVGKVDGVSKILLCLLRC